MKVCDRCRVAGCLLDYGGKACKSARKRECPDVVFTRADEIRDMDNEEMAREILRMIFDLGEAAEKVDEIMVMDYLGEPVEVM